MTLVPVKIKDGSPRNSIGQLISVTSKVYPNSKWLISELSKVEGGMDGLIRTETGYTNKLELQEVA